MKAYYNEKFTGVCRWMPVFAIVSAETRKRAAEILNKRLVKEGLKGDALAKDMVEITTKREYVLIPINGDD